MSADDNDAKLLSRLLFEARESLEMWADVIEAVEAEGPRPSYTRTLIKQIDNYRASRGWPANGFG